ncbi:MAG: CoA transferase, partial [Acidimicrobiia bacterium]
MSQRLLDGVRVVDLGGDPGARAGRVLGDLGATVVRVVPRDGDPLTGNIAVAWNAGKEARALAADDPALDELLSEAAIVFDTPGVPGVHQL